MAFVFGVKLGLFAQVDEYFLSIVDLYYSVSNCCT